MGERGKTGAPGATGGQGSAGTPGASGSGADGFAQGGGLGGDGELLDTCDLELLQGG